MIDTHAHLDGEEFRDDLPDVIQRACDAGVEKIFVPAIDLKSSKAILELCRQYPDRLYPMVGLHPEEVRADWREQLAEINTLIHPSPNTHLGHRRNRPRFLLESRVRARAVGSLRGTSALVGGDAPAADDSLSQGAK